ncbi:calcium-transporting ATPase 4, plasma membrane-type-like isoform X1 [Cucumis melo var. makuwa]|uniref:Calcium-transporting ATPase 4, plasma membrane-type-like isoform X1 n=1 Tax=Cucumis melo var. makuwa TaxID=1194695 RepID=A0A5D3DPJ2_CUCMM|nr:calcium-transporting ATPase 4, plasma membrane-type-like isoform X1 [Cucumis melo var. makuwa]
MVLEPICKRGLGDNFTIEFTLVDSVQNFCSGKPLRLSNNSFVPFLFHLISSEQHREKGNGYGFAGDSKQESKNISFSSSLFRFYYQRASMNMEQYLLKDFEVEPKHPSEQALRRWRSAVSIVRNRRRRFRNIADLDKRSEAEKKKLKIQV